jgi:hypothetical protein
LGGEGPGYEGLDGRADGWEADLPAGLTMGTVLQPAPNITLRVNGSGRLLAFGRASVVDCGPRGFSIMDAFSEPKPLGRVLAELPAAGAQDWVDTVGTVVALVEAGILRAEDGSSTVLSPSQQPPDLPYHAVLLNDRERTTSFVRAIGRVVLEDDVVLEIGTGTGVLAIAAARAGARHVYAVEANPAMVGVAESLVKANGLEGRISVIEGWSSQVVLSERADLLVAELIGNSPLDEQVLEATLDAQRRLLTPDARLIPRRLKVLALPVLFTDDVLETWVITPDAVSAWSSWYGMNFSPLADMTHGRAHHRSLFGRSLENLEIVGEPVVLADVDLSRIESLQVESAATLTMDGPVTLNGILMYFEAELARSVVLSTHPTVLGSHWRRPLWFLDEPLHLEEGRSLRISYSYRVPGRANGLEVRPA